MKNLRGNKVVVIGTGFVGSATAFTLVHSGLLSELVLIDINKAKAEGEVMDLNHSMYFLKPVDIKVGDYSDCKDADIIIITAGPSIAPGETRLDLAHKNAKIMKSMMEEIIKYTRDAIILVATNPVDIMTYVACKSVNYDQHKVIGSGTVLDTSRFRYLISEKCHVDVRSIHSYIIGEHGDSEVAAWSLTNIAGTRIDKYCPSAKDHPVEINRDEILNSVRKSAYEIIKRKGSTSYGIALALRRITEAILRDEDSILTVSSILNGEYGLNNLAISIPTIVNRKGIEKVLNLPLEDEEIHALTESAKTLKNTINSLDT